MKAKRKPETRWERIRRVVRWVFFGDWGLRLGWIILGAAALLVLLFVIAWVLVVNYIPPLPMAHEIYQNTYDDCMVAETLTAEQCHEIALAVVGDG